VIKAPDFNPANPVQWLLSSTCHWCHQEGVSIQSC